jgi:hypothetical protein
MLPTTGPVDLSPATVSSQQCGCPGRNWREMRNDPQFLQWLRNEYFPIAGAWHY